MFEHGLTLTAHAMKRLQQRGISRHAVDLIALYGTPCPSRGAESIFIDRSARRRLRLDFGRRLGSILADKLAGKFLIVGDGDRVITVSHGKRRFRRS